MSEALLLPFTYSYMVNAIWVSALVGGTCALLSAFLMLKGWSLIGDALSHSVVPGVAGAYLIGIPFSLGAFLSGGLAAFGILALRHQSHLKEDTIIGIIFTGFFGVGLFMASLNPISVDLHVITMGNILAITPSDTLQLVIIAGVTLTVLLLKWKTFMVTFFDPIHGQTIGINTGAWTAVFFTLLAAATVAAMQTVGAFLVVAMVITPGATAYLLTDRFERLLWIATLLGVASCAIGAYLSFFLNGATGGIIVCLQTLAFALAFLFAPQHGLWASKRRA